MDEKKANEWGIRDECLRRGFVAVTRWLWSSVVVLWCSWFVVGTVLCWLLFVVVVVVFVAVFPWRGKARSAQWFFFPVVVLHFSFASLRSFPFLNF